MDQCCEILVSWLEDFTGELLDNLLERNKPRSHAYDESGRRGFSLYLRAYHTAVQQTS